ncbi:MAG: DUF4254 domain-containing protein [Planctomycetota bacterium]|jgi:hypothetical protein
MSFETNVQEWFQQTQAHAERIFAGDVEAVRTAEQGDAFRAALAEITIHNATLWGHEDQVRRTDIADPEIVKYKRLIDHENQMRNNSIDEADHILRRLVAESLGELSDELPLNTETPGSAFDRLSIMALRIISLEKEIARTDASDEHKAKCAQKKGEVEERVTDLSRSLQELLADIAAGRKRLKSYNMHKLYNDPETNPAVRGA